MNFQEMMCEDVAQYSVQRRNELSGSSASFVSTRNRYVRRHLVMGKCLPFRNSCSAF